ncbi:MAG: hypothetical protein ACO38P_12100, partial [Phycisphaerales bacterium]
MMFPFQHGRSLLAVFACIATPAIADTPETTMSDAAAVASPERLRAWHDLLAHEPQVAGTEADHRSIERLDAA